MLTGWKTMRARRRNKWTVETNCCFLFSSWLFHYLFPASGFDTTVSLICRLPSLFLTVRLATPVHIFQPCSTERKKGGLIAVRGATKPQRPQTPPLFSGCLEFCFAQTEKQLLLSRSLPLLMLKPNPKTWFLRMIVLLVWSKMSEALFF